MTSIPAHHEFDEPTHTSPKHARVVFDLPKGQQAERRSDGLHRPLHPHIAEVIFFESPPPGSLRHKLDEAYLSGSQLSTFDWCEQSYYYSYGLGLRTPVGTRMLLGTAAHEYANYALYDRYRAYAQHGSFVGAEELLPETLAAARAAAHNKLDAELESHAGAVIFEPRWDKGPIATPDTLHQDLELFITLMYQELLPTVWPIALEAALFIRWSDRTALPFFGFLDILGLNRDGDTYVLDLKTGSRAKSGDDLAYDLKMLGYACTARLALGRDIRSIQYANLLRHKDGPVLNVLDVPYEPRSVIRLAHACADMSKQLAAGIYKKKNSKMACPKCAFFDQCEDRFGPIVARGPA